MIHGLVALALPIVAAVRWSRPFPLSRHGAIEELALGLSLALGVASVIWTALLFLGLQSRTVVLTVDAAIWIAIIAAVWRTNPRVPAAVNPPRMTIWPALALLVPIGALAVVTFMAASRVAPHGEWDAWSQWNLRARFLYRGFPDEWRNAFAPVLSWSHADYPLLLPASIARMWLQAGRETTAVPVLLSACLAGLSVVLAGASVARAHGPSRGCLAAAAILACPSFVRYAPAQCADIPLGLFILASFVSLSRATTDDAGHWWAASGCAAALAGWTKNEGSAFFVVFSIAVLVVGARTAGRSLFYRLGVFAAGAAPTLLVLLIFKYAFAPPSYFVAEQSFGHAVASLLVRARVEAVVGAMAGELWLSGASAIGVLPAVAAFVLIVGVRRPADGGGRAVWPVLLMMLLIYATAYLTSPKDLAWQLRTSVDRVVVQLVPTIVWGAMMIAR